jgi:hypothetical protein
MMPSMYLVLVDGKLNLDGFVVLSFSKQCWLFLSQRGRRNLRFEATPVADLGLLKSSIVDIGL